MELQNINIILSVIVVFLLFYKVVLANENFDQIDICDYDSPNPDDFCKSIQKGCSDLIVENKNLNKNINDNCNVLPTDTHDVINTAINCSDTVNKIIMNNYVQKEVCSQIKNFPPQSSMPEEINTPAPTQPKLEISPQNDDYYINNEGGFAPF